VIVFTPYDLSKAVVLVYGQRRQQFWMGAGCGGGGSGWGEGRGQGGHWTCWNK